MKNISSQKTSKYVRKSRQMRTYSMSKHVIRTCLYSPFYYYDFILMSLYCNCYVRTRVRNIRINVNMTNYLAVHSEMTRKRPRFGAIPKVNMPRKNHETPKPQPRARQNLETMFWNTGNNSAMFLFFQSLIGRLVPNQRTSSRIAMTDGKLLTSGFSFLFVC